MDVLLTPEAQRQFDRLPTLIKVRVLGVFERMRKWPAMSGAKALRAPLAGAYRVRTGDYRIQFRVDGKRLIVERVGHRDGFYDE